MNCERCEECVQMHLDGELSVEDAIQMGQHLAGCKACNEFSRDLNQLGALTVSAPVHPQEGKLVGKVLAQIDASRISPRRHWFAVLAASTAVAALLVMTLKVQPPTPDQPREVVVTPKKEEVKSEESPLMLREAEPNADAPVVDGETLMKGLLADQFMARHRQMLGLPKEQRDKRLRLERLLRELHVPGKAGEAAVELAGLEYSTDPQRPWQVAAAVADPAVGREVFEALSKQQPELRLAPAYIAALDQPRLRTQAREMLCIVSGKKFGPDKEVWLAWWLSPRAPQKNEG